MEWELDTETADIEYKPKKIDMGGDNYPYYFKEPYGRTHAGFHTCVRLHANTYMCALTHTYTHMHTHALTHNTTHTHTHLSISFTPEETPVFMRNVLHAVYKAEKVNAKE